MQLLRSVRLSWLLLAIVVLGFLGWRWWDNEKLWSAARTHYLGPYSWSPEQLAKAVAGCENAAAAEGLFANGDWSGEPFLIRGMDMQLSDELAWERDYQFRVVFLKSSAEDRVNLVCVYEPDRRTYEVSEPILGPF